MNRIVAFANAFWMTGRGIGGGDRRAIEILKRFATHSISVVLVTTKMGYENFGRESHLKCFITPYASHFDRFGVVVSYVMRAILCPVFFNPSNTDILYSTSGFLPDVFPPAIYKLRSKNTKWIQVLHHLIPHYSQRKGSSLFVNLVSYYEQRISLFFVRHFSDVVVVVNPLMKEQLLLRGFNGQKVIISANGVSQALFERAKTGNQKYDGAFLGRLHPSKGIYDLVRIWRIVNNNLKDAKLAIIGDSDERTRIKLEKEIRKSGAKIDILGFLDDEKVASTLKSSRVFLFPSYEEGFGISILEAMASGLPVVAWNLPVYREIFQEGMIRVEIGSVNEFAKAVITLLQDEKVRQTRSQISRRISASYSWDNIADNELRIVTKLAKAM